jgi:nitrogen regulatory protein PII
MKKIECYLREDDVDALLAALNKSGINGVTVTPVRGFGRQRGKEGHLLPKVKVEMLALEAELDDVLRTVTKFSRSGKYGDGKIAITELFNVIRIRTGESGPKALL